MFNASFYSFLGKDVQVRHLNLLNQNEILAVSKTSLRALVREFNKQIFNFFQHFSFDGRMCSLMSKGNIKEK